MGFSRIFFRAALALCVLTFVGLALLRVPLALLLLGIGGPTCLLTWRRLGAIEAQREGAQ